MIPVETNRVKSIRSRFESLGEQSAEIHNNNTRRAVSSRALRRTNIPVQCGKVYLNAKKQLQKQNSEPLIKESSSKRHVLSEINDASELQSFNFKKRLKEVPDSDLSPESLPLISEQEKGCECKLAKSHSVLNGEKPRVLSRQTSDPSRKLQRSPAFRCDRNHKVWEGCRRSLREDTLRSSERPRLSREKLKVLGTLLDQKMKEEKFVFEKNVDLGRKPSMTDAEVPKHILDQYAKVVKPKNKSTADAAMSDSGISSENENLVHEPDISNTKALKAHFEKPALTDTLKKALKQPLPPGPPPKKPPRTFAAVLGSSAEVTPLSSPTPVIKNPFSIEITSPKKRDSKAMLEKLELALIKHNSGKILTPRPVVKDDSPSENINHFNRQEPNENKLLLKLPIKDRSNHKFSSIESPIDTKSKTTTVEKNTKSPTKDVHYLCTEILGLHNTSDSSVTSDGGLSSLAKCFNSLNCTNASARSSIGYIRLESDRNSISSSCCACSNLEDLPKVVSFNSPTKSERYCRKCGLNILKDDKFQCHLGCSCKESNPTVEEIVHLSNSTFFAGNIFAGEAKSKLKRSRSQEHIYAEPFQHEGASEMQRAVPPLLRTATVLEDGFRARRCGFSTFIREERPEEVPAKNNTEPRGNKVRDILQKLESKNTTDPAQNPAEYRNCVTGKSVNFAKQVNNIYDAPSIDDSIRDPIEAAGRVCGPVTEPSRRRPHGRRGRSQVDIDKENLNRLMNDIYETVAAACQLDSAGMDSNRMCCSSSGDVPCHCSNDASLEDDAGVQRLAKFPVNKDNTDTSSEDSVKLTRSLTEKRKNYVRRVSSRASYLQANNADGTHVRYRHQTSVISAPIVTPDREPVLGKCTNPYATFRSWKSFKMLHSDRNIDDCGLDQMNPLDVADGSMFGQEDRLDNGAQESGEERLFEACILVGMNHSTGRAYIKSSYPRGVRLPPQIETLVFPETLSDSSTSPSSVRRKSRNGETKSDDRRTGRKMYNVDAKSIQCYSLVLTNERGERNFGYCRRVLPEGATFCLPLTYCLISKYRSTGFFYKILELIESHHGSPDVRMESALRQLHESKFPQPGESLHLRQPRSPKKSTCNYSAFKKNSAYRNSVNLGDVFQARALKVHGEGDASAKTSSESLLNGLSDDGRRRSDDNSSIFYDMENNNLSDDSQGADEPFEELSLKMSLEPRLDEDNLSILFDSLSVSMICKIFGTLLIERKVILVGENLSQLSSCIEALQTILYPFVWQHTLISTVPSEIRKDILEAPIPVLAGVLLATSKNAPPPQRKEVPVSKSKTMPNIALGAGDGVPHGDDFEEQIKNVKFEEGMLVELSSKNGNKPLFNQGDESSLLPSYSAKTLKASLSLDNTKDKAKGDSRERTRNFLIAEAFLRFFIDLIGDYWKFFTFDKISEHSVWHGTEQEDTPADAQFEKDQFIKNASSKQNQYFLEWFTETAMFDHFKSNMATMSRNNRSDAPLADGLIDLPYPDFYRLFEERIAERRAAQDAKKTGKSEAQTKAHDNSKSANYKLLINKKVRLLKNKLRDLVNLE